MNTTTNKKIATVLIALAALSSVFNVVYVFTNDGEAPLWSTIVTAVSALLYIFFRAKEKK